MLVCKLTPDQSGMQLQVAVKDCMSKLKWGSAAPAVDAQLAAQLSSP